MQFKEYLRLVEQNTVGTHNDYAQGAFLNSWQMGLSGTQNLEGNGPDLANQHVVPTVTKSAQIKFIERNRNPIFILLSDGTRLYLTWDEFRRVKGDPEVGKTMTVVFQRFPGDTTESTSQIASVQVH